jgi:hypothetical protein
MIPKTLWIKDFLQLGTSQNLLRGQISRLRRICVNQRFTPGKGPPLGANFARS